LFVRRALLVLVLLLGAPGTASAAAQITFGSHPATPVYGKQVVFSGVVSDNGSPAAGQPVDLLADTGGGWTVLGSTVTQADGSYSFALQALTPGSYAAQTPGATSTAVALTLRPRLSARIAGLAYPGNRLVIRGRLRPAKAGALRLRVGTSAWNVKVRSGGRYWNRLPTRRLGHAKARLRVVPAAGFAGVVRERHYRIRAPYLSLGSRGRAVLALEKRLNALHFRVRFANGFYGVDTYEAVLAFQKVHRLSRTGRVTRDLWGKLGWAKVPRARHRGDHIEVDKARQVLFEVRNGEVVRVIHVSTGATGNTPLGRYHVYLKTPGLLPSGMYYSLFWHGAFAIHGYHSVPAWPASHGCVRIPMWQAPRLFSRWGLGSTVYVYV
jgi:L,D-transpeptidase catalytic domain/Putative peptidoglycan binding domain